MSKEHLLDIYQPKLDPCPFCAGAAYLATYNKAEWWVECNRCGVSTLSVKSQNEAVARWGNRTNRGLSDEMRLKLDRRIHNQRLALRENWMITEQRSRWMKRDSVRVSREIVHFMNDMQIPLGPTEHSQYGFWFRLRMLKEKCLSLLERSNEQP